MDVSRVKEIIESADKIDVTLDDQAVWIDSVDATTQMATVYAVGEIPVKSQTVSVQQLSEVE